LPERRTRAISGWRGFVVPGAVFALIFIIGIDKTSQAIVGSTAEVSILDEPAHLATAALLLAALAALFHGELSIPFVAAALVASVAIDIDHVPQFLGWNGLTVGTPRPYTHSLIVPVVALLVALPARRQVREVALGVAFGVCAHLFRDLATGSGVALFWPVSTNGVVIPYLIYAAGAVSLTAAVLILSPPQGHRKSTVSEPSGELG
jgi:inner membrane protein